MSGKIKKATGGLNIARRLALAPYSVWAMLFIVVPLVFVAYYAFTDQQFSFTAANVSRFFTEKSATNIDVAALLERLDTKNPFVWIYRWFGMSMSERLVLLCRVKGTDMVYTYRLIFMRSLALAIISTVICLILGYPFAYMISKASPRAQNILITIIMIPMWMNFLIRTYAWMVMLQDTGIINNFLASIGFEKGIRIIGTEKAVIIGMVYDYFPYMILPIYSVMAKMDGKLIEAARDLGCSPFGVLRRVIFPLSLPGVISGIMMVLIPSISTFYISQKLGYGKFLLVGDVIEGQYTAGNLHFAAAIAFILMVILLAGMAVMQRAANKRAVA